MPRLYQTVQQCGGLSAVIESGRWQTVADTMRIPKLAQDRITKLDDIYCKYLLPYDILSHGTYQTPRVAAYKKVLVLIWALFLLTEERERIFDDIEKEWAAHLKKSSDDELFEDVDECVLKVSIMLLRDAPPRRKCINCLLPLAGKNNAVELLLPYRTQHDDDVFRKPDRRSTGPLHGDHRARILEPRVRS